MGCNPTTGAPILPEHDMELAFDVQLSVEDIMEVRPGACSVSFCVAPSSKEHSVCTERSRGPGPPCLCC